MPRMAERIAGTFAPRKSAAIGEPTVHVKYRTHSRANSGAMSRGSLVSGGRRTTIIDSESGALDLVDSEHNDIIDIIQEANMDGVRHLKDGNTCTRTLWCAVIVIFVILALFQIYSQIMLYYKNPVATNIEAEYPSSIPFPTVAICNNNQFRLTYITGARILNRKGKSYSRLQSLSNRTASVFDQVIEKTWDMDAVKFLRNAAHWKSRMILGCWWPNGTSCRLSDFKAVWTMTGLCWAINTDVHNPLEVTGSGSLHGLKLLLNVESYERVDACTPHFRTKSLPGLKILIYNQTYVPESSLSGVNVPSGYSMDIPFRMQHRNKLPGVHCIEETEEHLSAREDFDNPNNIRTCSVRKYMAEIERSCNCSLRRAYNPNPKDHYPFCTVDDYFGCVQEVVRQVQAAGSNSECLPPCQVIDYTAWQDMNRLPQNLMPTLIEDHEEEDETDVNQDDIEEERYLEASKRDSETFSCRDSAYLDEKQVSHIKRDAHRAYEKQSRYQEDIFLRSKRLILRLRAAINNLSRLKWGWHGEDYRGIYERLQKEAGCFVDVSDRHDSISTIMRNRPPMGEEKRAAQIHFLLDADSHRRSPHRFKTIGEVKTVYGDRVEEVLKEIQTVLVTIEKMWHLFEEKTYHSQLTGDLSRMDRITQLMNQYESGHLQRRAWAEKMQSRQMRHFFEEDFMEDYYQPIMKDLDQSLLKTINEIENDHWPKLKGYMENGTAFKTGAILFFDSPSDENLTKFRDFLSDVHNCTTNEVKHTAELTLKYYKKAFRQLQAAYANLFKKELPDYLENFEFGSKFVSDNFAMVNIFLHQMHIERWSQDRTYTFWSLACDVGGALGLFLGASLLTIIELIYLCFQYGFCGDNMRNLNVNQLCSHVVIRRRKSKKVGDVARSYEPTEIIEKIDKTPAETPKHQYSNEEEVRPKRSIWPSLYMDIPTGHPDDQYMRDYDENQWMEPPIYFQDDDYGSSELLDGRNSPSGSHDLNRLQVSNANDRLTDILEESSQLDSDKSRNMPPNSEPVRSLGDTNPPLTTSANHSEEDDVISDDSPRLLFRGAEKYTTL